MAGQGGVKTKIVEGTWFNLSKGVALSQSKRTERSLINNEDINALVTEGRIELSVNIVDNSEEDIAF